jgi:hypothetical protein
MTDDHKEQKQQRNDNQSGNLPAGHDRHCSFRELLAAGYWLNLIIAGLEDAPP